MACYEEESIMVEIAEIERRIDRAVTATIPVATGNISGFKPENYLQMQEFAKTMATCKASIPAWLRGSIGDCLAITNRAQRWGLDPFFVAEMSYMMTNTKTGEVTVGYQSQLIHAIVESLAPLKGRLRHKIMGEGDNRYCVVWGTFKNETEPHEFTSEPLGKRIKDIGRSANGNFRGSPLWLQKPNVQLFYDASRDWARINCPDVLGGVYAREELPDHEMVDVTPQTKSAALAQRLREANMKDARGFDADRIASTLAASANPGGAKQEDVTNDDQRSGAEPVADGDRRDDPDDIGVGDLDQTGGDGIFGADSEIRGESAGEEGAPEDEDQSKVFPPDRITSGPQPQQPKTRR
jgi:hypothetical protein